MNSPALLNIDDKELLSNNINIRELMFCITLTCNLRCKICYLGNDWLNSNLSFSDIEVKSILNHYGKKGLDRLTFLGGEPFLHPNITDFIIFARQFDIKEKRITTNCLDLGFFDLKRLDPSDLDHISVSFDGTTKETHEFVRGKNTFDRTVENIKKLVNHGFKIHTNFTVTGFNKHEVIDAVKFSRNLGASEINFHLVSLIGNAKNHTEFKVTPKEWIDIRKKLKEIKDVKGIDLRIPIMYVTKDEYEQLIKNNNYYPIQEKSYYSGSGQRIVLYPNSKVYMSCDLTGTEFNFANYSNGKFTVSKTRNEISSFNQGQNNPDISSDLLNLNNQGFVRLSISYKEKIKLA